MITAFFGFQIAFDLPVDDPRRTQLALLVGEIRQSRSMAEQRASWTHAAELLRQAMDSATYGTWDLIRTNATASYDEWVAGLEAMAQWPPSDFGDQGRFLLVTGVVLVIAGSNADATLGDGCDIPQRDWQREQTYLRLIGLPGALNPTNVLRCAFYAAPRPDQPGFSQAVLTGEGFTYLVPIGA